MKLRTDFRLIPGLLFVLFLLASCSAKSGSVNPQTNTTQVNPKSGTVAVANSPNNAPGPVTVAPGTPIGEVPTISGSYADVLGSDGYVFEINLANNQVIETLSTNTAPPQNPYTLAVTPGGGHGVIVSDAPGKAGNSLVPVDFASSLVGSPIPLPFQPVAVALDPSGSYAWVTGASGELASVDLASRSVSKVHQLLNNPDAYLDAIAISPNGNDAVVVDDGGASAGNRALIVSLPSGSVVANALISQDPGSFPDAVAISSEGSLAFVVDGGYGNGTLTPLSIPGGASGDVINVGGGPLAICLSSDGKTAYVANGGTGAGDLVVPVDISGGFNIPGRSGGTPFEVGGGVNEYLDAIGISPNGESAYLLDRENGLFIPLNLKTGLSSKPIGLGHFPISIAITNGS
ncbi:MAG: YncE family protein [Acidimicrobiales bacterium]|nr:YncE family protein [Acidimicrobiales bacterium]